MSNALYYGDNLEIMRTKLRDESVHLCYIDPPFNSKRNYNQIYNKINTEDLAQEQAFVDTWTWNDQALDGYNQIMSNYQGRFTAQTIELIRGLHGVLGEDSLLAYLVSLTLRLVEINRVLVPTGSFYLHCDPSASHYLKILIDSVFLPNGGGFLNEVIWKHTSAHVNPKRWGPVHDVLLFYTKTDGHCWNTIYQEYEKSYLAVKYRNKDVRGHFRLSDLTGKGRRGGDSGAPWKGYDPDKLGRHWAVPRDEVMGIVGKERAEEMSTQAKLDLLDANKFIYWTPRGKYNGKGFPQFKRYLTGGVPIQDVIADIPPINSQAQERLGYPTQKPEALMERLIQASSNEGDIILDAYCGCGTTIAVAQGLNRRWIGIDITYQAIATVLGRLEDKFGKAVVDLVSLDGIPKDMASANALAHRKDDRVRKEFEKWAILTYTDNRAVIKKKKGADGGIDGVSYFWNGGDADAAKMVLQAKSGNVQRKDVAALRGDMEKEGAALACLITLEEPTQPMRKDAKAAGFYENKARGIKCDRIRIVSIEDIVHGTAHIGLSVHPDATNRARKDADGNQLSLDLRPPAPEPERQYPQHKPLVRTASRKSVRSSRTA
jgi:DNA modification methylase